MSHEHKQEPKPQPLTLESVTQNAKEVTLKFGEHLPTLIVEGSQQGIVGQLPDLADTHERRLQQMFSVGFMIGQDKSFGTLEQIFFISEGWMSVLKEGTTLTTPPSKDPKRVEVLMVSHLNARERESALALLEMIRDTEGKLTDLQAFQPAAEQPKQVDSPLLRAFVNGFQAGREQPAD